MFSYCKNQCNPNLHKNQWFYIYILLYIFYLLPNNLVCGFISKLCILDISFSCAGIASTFSYSWVPCDLFSSWPLPLRSCGISGCTSSSWVIPFLWSYDSSIYTSSSWTTPFLWSRDSSIYISSSWTTPFLWFVIPQSIPPPLELFH
jgi:hypothetical protein